MTTLRARLLAVMVVLLVAGIVISDLVVLAELRRHLVGRVDRQVIALGQIASLIDPALIRSRVYPAPAGLDLIDRLTVEYDDPGRPVTGGVVEVRSWRVLILPHQRGGTVRVAASLDPVDRTLTRLRLLGLLTTTVLVLLLGVAGWFAIRASLRPLRTIEETAAAIAGGDLTHRVPDPGRPGSEMARLTGALNGMLAQIERAFADRTASEQRMRRFVADVSHELRTPLFGIAGSAELHLMGATGDPDRVMRRIDTEARRLTALVEDLLLLARLDEPAAGPVIEPEPMDLRTLAADARHDLHALDPARTVTLSGPGGAGPPGPAPVRGDEARLRQVVTNLIGNVHAHTPPGSPVRIGVGREGGEAVLEIADQGPGVPPGHTELIFERFHRAEGSRARGAGSGAGLGLSLVRSIAAAHGGRAEVREPAGGGATFRVVLPALSENSQDH
ncbi:HAMP domain-containing sensor histidine kinase [Actinoplanes sp. NBRC 101535]|uniref:sensor histidine kinase n=1 Tax=Actinoplanes sp. NBRC 101535 TaxID=3032196 RepID=UPI0024A54136|nr:HAMP domain-containing sensor histidine kinase [Actinoplanes sp. NBRC 101535]GLY00255.1 two-component sensor histidine kinase [Actinoplanes sp. NBRC 101535]